MASENGWRRRLNWSYWDLSADFPITRPLLIGLRVLTLCVAVPVGAFMLAGLALSTTGANIGHTLVFGAAFVFVALGAWFSLWDLRRLLRRVPHTRDP